ncbi:GerAB/ArcD/ProY family transporter [Cohnella yongneupensis]|uniref:GerAB/ArcD/ProY family transporter n=1 Tax=Cohnella yongneupensis TaxID=425006 RepID=A0ABW0QXK5_9BACL
MKSLMNERYLVTPYFVFFLISSNQIGIRLASFQRDLIKGAGYDAWISILLCGVGIPIIVWMMYRTLNKAKKDVTSINRYCFGKWVGNGLNVIVSLYFLLAAYTSLRSYIEVVQVWMFPLMKTWQISIIFLLLIYYIVSGGFRVITGVCFWGVVIPFLILFPLVFFPLEFARFSNLLPFFHHSLNEIWISTREMLPPLLGFESLLLFYPFIKNPEKSQKWAHIGVMFSIFIYLTVAIVSFLLFNPARLPHVIWPTIHMIKIVELPFIERFEYIVVSMWCLAVLPKICLSLWGACRALKNVIPIKQRAVLILFVLACGIILNVLDERRMIEFAEDVYDHIGFYFVCAYVPIIFIITQMKKSPPDVSGSPSSDHPRF